MPNKKITELPVATSPLAGTELAEIVQGGINKQVAVSEFGTGAVTDKLDALVTFITFTASHSLDSTDLTAVNDGQQYVIRQNSASANNLEIPLNATVAFPVGTIIGIRNINTGVVTITAVIGVTLTGPLNAFKLSNQYDLAYIEKVATNTWVVNGQLTV